MTYGELRAELDKIPAAQLQQEVRFWGDESAGTLLEVMTLQEDHINMGEGFEPESVYTHTPDYEDRVEARLERGTVILLVDGL